VSVVSVRQSSAHHSSGLTSSSGGPALRSTTPSSGPYFPLHNSTPSSNTAPYWMTFYSTAPSFARHSSSTQGSSCRLNALSSTARHSFKTSQSSAGHFSPPHSSIPSSTNSAPSWMRFHSTVPSFSRHSSSTQGWNVPSSSSRSVNASTSAVPHSLTSHSSAGHFSPAHSGILSRNRTPHSTAPSFVPHTCSIHRSTVVVPSSSITLRSTVPQSALSSASSQPSSSNVCARAPPLRVRSKGL
jgi:hypothetical protein